MNNSEITILNVDGGEASLYVKSRILRDAGYRVVEAKTGDEALRLIASEPPRLVLLSVDLPDQNGLEVCRRIKTDPARSSKKESMTSILLVSATFVDCEKRALSLEEGADGYLVEPVTPEFLLANIKTLLRRSTSDAESERLLADERRQTLALKRLALCSIAINSAESLDDILRLAAEEARELIGAHQAVANLTCGVSDKNALAANAGWPKAVNVVSLSEKYAQTLAQKLMGGDDPCPWSWICSLVCRLNQAMRLTRAELEAPTRLPTLEGVVTQCELMTLRQLVALGEVSAYSVVATPREIASLREMTALRAPRILRGLEMRGWLAAPLISRSGHNLGLIQLSEKYDGEFSEQDEAVLVQLAQMISIAIENRQLYQREQTRCVAAENASRMKDEFLAIVSHKLRTPLNAMLGWAWVLRRQSVNPEGVTRAAEIIERNARAQVRLVEEVLEASRLVSGKLRLEVKPLEIAPLIVATCDELRPGAEAKGVDLRLDIDSRAGTIIGDPARLQQVFWNLLSNAIKFTPTGGRVELRLERVGPELQLTVSDTGKGIDADVLPRMFDRFRQDTTPAGGARRGQGLGLAMVRHLVELHGGSVSVSSPGEGRGAAFSVKLPVNALSDWDEDRKREKWETERWRDGETERRRDRET